MKLQTQADVDEYFSHDKLECLVCGRSYKALATHIVRTHDISVDEYKDQFNLPYSSGLVGFTTRGKQRERMRRRVAEGDPSLMPIAKIASLGQQKKNRFRDYTKLEMGKRMTRHNVDAKTTSQEQMEAYVSYIEQHSTCPWRVTGHERELGIICTSTFRRNQGKFPLLRERLDATDKPMNGHTRTRLEIKSQVHLLRIQGVALAGIAKIVGIGKTTARRLLCDGQ